MNPHAEKHTARPPFCEEPARAPKPEHGSALTYAQKHRQANREAVATVIGLAATIVVWVALGFGLSGLDVELFRTPLWVIGGTIGTWAFTIALAVFLVKRVFKNFDLDEGAWEPRSEQERNAAFGSERSDRPRSGREEAR